MGTIECSQPAPKFSWDSQDFGDISMVLKMAHFRKSTGPRWVKSLRPGGVYMCIDELCQCWLGWWFVACVAPSNYLNQCWFIWNLTLWVNFHGFFFLNQCSKEHFKIKHFGMFFKKFWAFTQVSMCQSVTDNFRLGKETGMDVNNHESTLGQWMDWSGQATNHQLSHGWPRCVSCSELTQTRGIHFGTISIKIQYDNADLIHCRIYGEMG